MWKGFGNVEIVCDGRKKKGVQRGALCGASWNNNMKQVKNQREQWEIVRGQTKPTLKATWILHEKVMVLSSASTATKQ